MSKKLYSFNESDIDNKEFGYANNIEEALFKFCEVLGYKTIRIQEHIINPYEILYVLISNDDIENPQVFEITIKEVETLF